VTQILSELRTASKTDKNLMPYVIEAVKEYATEQEICDVWRDVFGEYREPAVRL
jgi:methylmalonyl-CoA mutase N-terminal domain/subunit